MANYTVIYTFYIDERKRPENFPKQVYVIDQYDNIEGGDQQMAHIYNKRFQQLASAGGVVVYLSQDIDVRNIEFNKRKYVPWHMITHSDGEVKLNIPQEPAIPLDSMVPEPLPDPKEEKKPTIQ